MSPRRSAPLSSRKEPQQARSANLVAAVLEAAVQVLAQEGAQRFTTARVAEKAGVSVGSLYQYFPNKAAILFRLQSDEWQRTTTLMRGILEDEALPPLARLRRLVQAFIRSECEEAEVRTALADAAPMYRDAPEAGEARATSARAFRVFLKAVLPEVDSPTRTRAGDLILDTLSGVGKAFSDKPRKPAEIEAYSAAMADMFCAYLVGLGALPEPAPPGRCAHAVRKRG
ncbi:TetR family transcriptional regulator [uncultured Pseudacidovorax sp.]|uniref:TetR family transcriptional regulator n=1 Tax=uncultured Pseudacidovorax sp. TaxID=679313 RepID=UPI0025DF3EC6|nr:TetR family transcriptional regulator [uncultured Pseudacidovorax sp.]